MEILTAQVSQRRSTSVFSGREPAYPLGPRFADPRQGLAGGCAPSDPPQRQRHMRGAGRDVWVKIRASEAERAEWHAKARSAGLTLSDLVRRSVGRVRPWTWRTRGGARAHPPGAEGQPGSPAGPSKRTSRPSRSSPTSPSSGRSRRWPPSDAPTPMHIKFLACGTGPGGALPPAPLRREQPSDARVPSSSASRDQAHNTSQTSSLWPAKSEEIP